MQRIKGTERFGEYADVSSGLMSILMEEEFKPEMDKTLKRWNMSEVSNLFGFSGAYLKKMIDKKEVPSGQLEGSRRTFSLSEIHRIREHLVQVNPERYGSLLPFRGKNLCQIVGITNFKGGVGKSTTTVTLAHDLCLRGYKVLIVDLDGQGSSTTLFGYIPNEDIEGKNTIEPYLERYHKANRYGFAPDDLSYCVSETHWENLDLIPANLEVSYADIALSGVDRSGFRYWEQLKNGLDTIKSNYDVILLDFPPSLGYLAINGIYASDSLIIPLPPDMLDFSSASAFFTQLYHVAASLEASTNRSVEFDFIKLLMTKCATKIAEDSKDNIDDLLKAKKQREAKRMLGYMTASFKDGLLSNEILKSDAISEAARHFKSVMELEASKTECSRSTLKRCIESVTAAHNEIDGLLMQVFEQRLQALSTETKKKRAKA